MSRIAYIFAGQGAQYVGMGKELSEEFPEAFDHLKASLEGLGIPLLDVCFNGPEDQITNTEFAQPGIFWVSWLAKMSLESRLPQLKPEMTAGLSLGEFTALASSGAFSFNEGLNIVHQRGKAMQKACSKSEGGMAAVIGLSNEQLGTLCDEAGVTMANLNCPGQIVISGEKDKVIGVCDKAKEAGAKRALPLQVAGAYHSPLMAPAAQVLNNVLGDISINTPGFEVISNVTARPHENGATIADRLVEQVTASVLWEDSIRYMIKSGIDVFVELGPGKALSGFMRRIDKSVTCVNVEDSNSLNKAVEVLSEMS